MGEKRRVLRTALALLLLAAVGFAAVTWLALESSDVAIVETQRADGSTRRTHVWWVEHDGTRWLEAGTPTNGWFVDVGADPSLRLCAAGRSGVYRVEPLHDPQAHARLRAHLHEKYGWRDAWVSIYVDQSQSVAVRLVPVQVPSRAC